MTGSGSNQIEVVLWKKYKVAQYCVDCDVKFSVTGLIKPNKNAAKLKADKHQIQNNFSKKLKKKVASTSNYIFKKIGKQVYYCFRVNYHY